VRVRGIVVATLLAINCASASHHDVAWDEQKLRVRVSPQFRLIGTQEFVLHNAARAEQHLFADGQRIVWIQFEQYLPGVEGVYDYSKDKLVKGRGADFRASVRQYTTPPENGSDRARAFELLRKSGVELPLPSTRVRLVHMPSADGRSEVMVIYAEPGVVDEATITTRALAAVQIVR
jgi:hypothetical protein